MHDPSGLGRIEHLFRCVGRRRERLLTDHVAAASDRRQRDFTVQPCRRRNADCVERLKRKHFGVLRCAERDTMALGGGRDGFRSPRAERHHLDVLQRGQGGDVSLAVADADDGHLELVTVHRSRLVGKPATVTASTCPWMYSAPGETRNSSARATSSSLPQRPAGIRAAISTERSGRLEAVSSARSRCNPAPRR